MDTDDEKDVPDSGVEPKSKDDDDFESSGPDENRLFVAKTLRAEKSGFWAELKVEYFWNANGTSFDCRAKQYRAKNGGTSGRLWFSLYQSPPGSTEGYSTNQNASQNGSWMNLNLGADIPISTRKARIGFTFTYRDTSSGIEIPVDLETAEYITWTPPTPPPTPVIGSRNFANSTFDVTGTQGLAGALMVLDHGGGTLAARVQPTGGEWLVPLTVADNRNSQKMVAYQQVEGVNSPRSELTYMYRAKLTYPTAGAVVPMKDLVYKAIGAPGSAMLALNASNIYESWANRDLIDPSGLWAGPSIKVLPSGDAVVKVRFYDDPANNRYGYTESVAFKVLGYPRITLPTAASTQNPNFDLSGDNGLAQSKVAAYYDLTNDSVGESQVRSDGTWTIPVTVRSGPVSLVVEQSFGGKSSGRGNLRTFKIPPPTPTKLTVQVDAQSNVTLGGVGYIGATFHLYVQSNMTAFHSFPVTTSPWTVLFPDWLPGDSLIGGRQSLPDTTGQPIYSDWAPENTRVVVPVPPPTLTFSVSPNGIPRFSGTGRNWSDQPRSLVEVRLVGGSSANVPIAEVGMDTRWSATATARWAPGTYAVTAIQRFKALQSEPVDPVSVVIPAPLAVIEKVIPKGLFAEVVGQCWRGAELTITFSDNPALHTVVDTDENGQWEFQRSTAFRPGRHTVSVKQTFGGETSNPVSMPFEIAVSVPVINPPPGGQTDHLPVLHGTGGIDGFTIMVFDYVTREPLGEAIATGDVWSVPLKELDYLTYAVFAIQVQGDLRSPPSNPVDFTVVLFAPRITFPETGKSVPQTFTVEGSARAGNGFDRTEVNVYVDGVPHPVYPHFDDGYFNKVFTLPLGSCVLNAKQYFKDQESPLGQDVVVTVVPDMALIETPGTDEGVGQIVVVCGFGYPGYIVVVALPDGTELGQTEVQEDGTWCCQVELPGTGTEFSIVTEQRQGEFRSGWSDPRSVQRLEAAPTFNEPSEGEWKSATPEFAGGARAGSKVDVVAWYDPDKKHVNALVTDGEHWAGVSERNLPGGPHWARAVQVVGGKRSMPADSKRFEISDEPSSLHPNPE